MVIPDEADEWLRRRFADDPDASIEIVPSVAGDPDPVRYMQFLKLLFAPRAES